MLEASIIFTETFHVSVAINTRKRFSFLYIYGYKYKKKKQSAITSQLHHNKDCTQV